MVSIVPHSIHIYTYVFKHGLHASNWNMPSKIFAGEYLRKRPQALKNCQN